MTPRRRRSIVVFVLAAVLTGCDGAAPANDWELASQGIYTASISTDGELSLIGSLNHGASLWRNSDHERLYNWNHKAGESAELVASGISPSGARAVTTDPRTLVLWDTASGQALNYWATPGAVLDLDVVRGGRQVLMGLADHSAVLFDAESGDHVYTFLHEGRVGSVDVADRADVAITGSEDETAVIWSLASGEATHTLAHDNPVNVVAVSPNGRYAFTASEHQLIAIWDAATGTRRNTLSTRNTGVTTARFSADDRYLLVGYVNRIIELWDVETNRQIKRWYTAARNPWHPTGAAVLEVAFTNRAGTFYALSGDGRRFELRQS